jgi:mannose-6-phosphate isomerase-like protein (cupin superfamily)
MSTPTPDEVREFTLLLGSAPRLIAPWDVYGEMITPILTGKQTGKSLSVFEVVTQPKWGPPLHVHHREDEAFYVLEGRYLFEYGEKLVEAGAGSYLFLPRGVGHTYQNIGETAGKNMVVAAPSGVEFFFEELSKITGPPDMAKIGPVFNHWGMELLGPPISLR